MKSAGLRQWAESLAAGPDAKLNVAVGSNVAQCGMALEEGRAVVGRVDLATGASRP